VDAGDLVVGDAFIARDDAVGRMGALVDELDRDVRIDPLGAMQRRRRDTSDDCPPLGP
jgi:hypothetical protein